MAHIINKPHYESVMSLLNSTIGTIHGCSRDPSTFFIELTLITDLIPDDILFKSEVFSPILPNPPRPLLQNPPGHALAYQPNLPSTPLATYIMSEDQAESPFAISHTSSGGVSTNDLFSQAVVPGMPFGGVGTSGNGKFHGKAGFEIFTNLKGVCNMPTGAEYEAMTEFRYATGDLERKYLMLKSMEEKAI